VRGYNTYILHTITMSIIICINVYYIVYCIFVFPINIFDLTDFQRFITNTLVNMKYDIGSILSIVQSNSININTLMINKNTSDKNFINLDNIFPIKSHNELESLETKMKDDNNFKNTLVYYF